MIYEAAGQLHVFHGPQAVGQITVDRHGRWSFTYAQAWLEKPDSFAISHSLPLASSPNDAPTARNFFVNLLPEGQLRLAVTQKLSISPDNDFALLAALGGDCAGSLTIGIETAPLNHDKDDYLPLPTRELEHHMAGSAFLPLMVGKHGVRLSLAGAQDKLPILYKAGNLYLPTAGSPSSHILKFPNRDFKHVVANEVLVSMLAQRLGLPACEVKLLHIGKQPMVLVTRYDRQVAVDGSIQRLHQEDFCQALGLPHHTKYQAEGGPSFATCFKLVTTISTATLHDSRSLLQSLSFNLLVGNADAHAKNFSMLMTAPGVWRLAPLYDLLATRIYPRLDRRLAMGIGGQTDPGQIGGRHLQQLAQEITIGARYLIDTVRSMAQAIEPAMTQVAQEFKEQYGDSPAVQMIRSLIHKQARRTLKLLNQ